jgi:hypothetical protein
MPMTTTDNNNADGCSKKTKQSLGICRLQQNLPGITWTQMLSTFSHYPTLVVLSIWPVYDHTLPFRISRVVSITESS